MKKEKKIPVEVYSRVVGYFRPVNQWNKGKREEFSDRVHFKINQSDGMNLYEFKEAVKQFKEGKEGKLREILIPAEESIREIFPVVHLSKKADLKHILTGKPLFEGDIEGKLPEEEQFAVFSEEEFIEIARKVGEGNIAAKPLFVLQTVEQ